MIGVIPKLYEDELVYSALARYHVYSGHLGYAFTARQLFSKPTAKQNIEYFSHLKEDVISALGGPEKLITDHTMYPWNVRFLSAERKTQAFTALAEGNNTSNIFLFRDPTHRELQYCPVCAEEDRKVYGEAYWHRVHQISGISVCPMHHCRLKRTGVEINAIGSPSLYPAEVIIGTGETVEICEGSLEDRLSAYMKNVLFAPLDRYGNHSIGLFLKHRMKNTDFISARGDMVYVEKLYRHYSGVFKTVQPAITKQYQIGKILCDIVGNPLIISQLAFCLDIPAEDLCRAESPKQSMLEEYDQKIRQLHDQGYNYRQISQMIGGSYDYVKKIGCTGTPPGKRKGVGVKGSGVKRRDYAAMDEDMLPRVKDIMKNSQVINGKPVRVSRSALERLLGLSETTLKNMPQCYRYFLNHSETPEEFWIRELKWMYNNLLNESASITVTKLAYTPFNLSRQDLERIFPLLNEEDPVEAGIKQIIIG